MEFVLIYKMRQEMNSSMVLGLRIVENVRAVFEQVFDLRFEIVIEHFKWWTLSSLAH
jgi:hypothetical protein